MSETFLCKILHKFLSAEKSFQDQKALKIHSAIVLATNEAWSLNDIELKQIHIVPFRNIRKKQVINKRDDLGVTSCDYVFKIISSVLAVLDVIPFILSSISGWIVLCNSEGLIGWIKKQVEAKWWGHNSTVLGMQLT